MFEQFTENDFKEKNFIKEQLDDNSMNPNTNQDNSNKMDIDETIPSNPTTAIPAEQGPDYNSVEDLKKIIYKTYSKSIDKSKDNKKKERKDRWGDEKVAAADNPSPSHPERR